MEEKAATETQTPESDAKATDDSGSNWETRFKGLQRKYDETRNESMAAIEQVRNENEQLKKSLGNLVEALGSVAIDGQEQTQEETDPFAAIMNKVTSLEQQLAQQQAAAEEARLRSERTKMLAEYDLVDMDAYIRVDNDLDKQREIIQEFAEKLSAKTKEAVTGKKKSSSSPPPKTPKTPSAQASSIDALRERLDAAADAGDPAAFDKARNEYYAALSEKGVGTFSK